MPLQASQEPPPSPTPSWKRFITPLIAALAIAAQLFGKLKFFILPALKFIPAILKTGGSMIVTIWLYAMMWGWPFAVGFVLLIFSPIIAKAMQAAVSRKRETLADVSACQLTRYPPGLISALEKLRDDQTVVQSASRASAHLWIESPLARTPEEGKMSKLNRMFDTHPPLDERIAALQEL